MLIIPAIDLKNGKCVRLLQGDPDRETVYSDDPVAMARRFEELGAGLIHVVDLDGAFAGRPVNHDLVVAIAKSVGIPIEIGGGIRDAAAIERYIDSGIRRIILGSAVLESPLDDLLARFGEYLIAGVDARDSLVAIHGWKTATKTPALDFIKDLKKKGMREIIYTDIATDGMLTGPNYGALRAILEGVGGISLIASGGVSSIDDIMQLRKFADTGLKGCIVGKAIYDGRLDLGAAIKAISTD